MTTLEEIFGEPISVYTDEQAIEDGVLIHRWPEKWPWLLLTNSVDVDAAAIAETRGVKLDAVLVPLAMDAVMEVRRVMKSNPRCDLVELEHTAVGTVYVRPNSKGGLTIMKPEDN